MKLPYGLIDHRASTSYILHKYIKKKQAIAAYKNGMRAENW
jgi:hypothetical protein